MAIPNVMYKDNLDLINQVFVAKRFCHILFK